MKRILVILPVIIFLTAAYQALSSQPSKYENKTVNKIEFSGLSNVDKEDVEEIMITTVGYPLKSSEIREDIKKIFAMGKFKNVQVEIDEYGKGVKLRFIIEERAVVEKIIFKGYEELLETELLEMMQLKEGATYRKDLLDKSIKALVEKYHSQGYFSAYVRYKIEDGEDKNTVKVVVIIDEGEEIKVRKISILGANKIYSETIVDLMETKEDSIFNDGSFKRDVYNEDKRKIVGYYQQEGYLDAQIVDEQVKYEWVDPVKQDDRGIFLILKLSEGDRYYFDDKYTLNFRNGKSEVLKDREIKRLEASFSLRKKGEIFDNTKFLNDRQSISFLYASKGYIFARVIPRRTVTEREVVVDGKKEKRKFVKIDFQITEGKKAYIEQIIIKGNQKTKEKVIRRELSIKEGQLFNSTKMQMSREKVFNLGYFKQVDFDVRPGSRDGYMNLVIDVEEQPTGTISLGGGYGSSSGFSIFADVKENNLFGNGQTVGIKFEYGPEKSSVTLSFSERWLLDHPIGFNSSIFYYKYQYDTSSIFPTSDEDATYKKQAVGYSLGLSRRFWYYWVTGATWIQTFKTYMDASGNSPDSVFENVEDGTQLKHTVKLYMFRDSKNNYLNPTSGIKTGMSVSFTGGPILRGDDHYIQYSPEFSAYYSPFHLPFLKSHPTVLEFRASGDFICPPFGKSWLEKNKP